MARYDVVVIGAGLGGLTAGAILARAGRKVLVIERNNSVGGAASSYKSGDLFVEGSLHETSDPHHPRDPKHNVLTRAGVIDAVKWIPAGAFYEARGGPLGQPFVLPDNFDAARRALTERFPEARAGIDQLLEEMERIASAIGTLSQGSGAFRKPREVLGALLNLLSGFPDWRLSLSQKLDRVFGDNEAVKCALAANLSYYHDDPATLWWVFFAIAQGGYLLSGGRYVQGGSQRLSSALARAIKVAGGEVLVRRVVSGIAPGLQGHSSTVTHSARDGSDARRGRGKIGRKRPAAHAIDFAVRAHARPIEAAARVRDLGLFDATAAARNGAAVRLRARHRADGGGTRETNAADVDRRLRRDRFRSPRSALCAVDLWARPAVELGQFGHGRLSREARAMAAGDRRLSLFGLSGPRRRRGGVVVQYRAVGAAISQCA